MKKVIVITPCFCPAELLEKSILRYEATVSGDYERWLLLNHWPIDTIKNNKELCLLASKYNYKIFDNEYDRGLHNSINNFLKNNPQPSGTILLGFDPDSDINDQSKGWDKAIVDVLSHNPKIAICALWNAGIKIKANQCVEQVTPNGVKYITPPRIEMINVGGFDIDFITSSGGFNQSNAYYGGIESDLCNKMKNSNKNLAFLIDYKELLYGYKDFTPKFIQEFQWYQNWKVDHLKGFKKSFKEWLIIKNLI